MAINNAINNASSLLSLDPGASGDPLVQFNINTTGEFILGVDDSDSDSFKIALGSALGTNDSFIMTSAGERTMPLQPAFLLTVTSTIVDVTGDGTGYNISFDTEVFDRNSDVSGSTFTAPVTGRYQFQVGVVVGGLLSGHTRGSFYIVTSNRNYLYKQTNPYAAASTATYYYGVGASVLGDMDSGDTAYTNLSVTGSTKVIDIQSNGATDPYTWFSGFLMV